MARAMKDSGVPWIGAIPKEWKVVQLKRYCFINSGKEILEEVNKSEDAIPVYGSGGIFKYTTTFLHDDETVMFGRKGTLGKPIYTGGKFWAVDTMYYLTFSKRLLPKFCYYQFVAFDWNPLITQTALPSIVGSEVISCNFAFPLLEEQHRIAAFLDAECARIDDVIEKTRESIEEYKKLKQAVITRAVTKGIRPNRAMKDSGIEVFGNIPESWDCCKLKHLISSLNSGTSISATELTEEGFPVFGGGQKIGFFSNYNMENTLVIGRVGAKCGCVTKVEGKAWATDNALIVSTTFPKNYLYYILLAAELNKLNTSNAQPLITSGKVLNYKVPIILNKEEQNEIVKYLDEKCAEIDTLIAQKEQLIVEMESYKKSLIYEYVTGKKEVQNND